MNNKKLELSLAWASILAGVVHIIFVSFLHFENFLEVWFFTFAGSTQLFLGLYTMFKLKGHEKAIKALIVVHGSLIVLWLATRIFDAPFSTFPEAIGVADTVIVLLEVIAIALGARLLGALRTSFTLALVLSLVVGGLSYGVAKASENIIKSIPIESIQHAHSFHRVFESNEHHMDEVDDHHDKMEEIMDDHHDEMEQVMEDNHDEVMEDHPHN